MPQFAHLHNHTEFSLLDGAAKIEDMTDKAVASGMTAIAITDHGNMFGVPKFVLSAKRKGLKAIVGCEFYIIAGDATSRDKGTQRFHQIMWAKNAIGYQNLVKLCSYGYTDGYYYKPRIDKHILRKHAEGLVASTCCLAGEVNRALIDKGEVEAERLLKEYIDIFGKENYYIEIQRHTLGDMDKCNEWLLRMAKKHDLDVIATNDVHYVNQEDSEAHDLLLALQTQSEYSDPNRFRFTDDKNRLNPRFYFKTTEEMLQLFHDVPHALDNTMKVADQCAFEMNLSGDMILPQYKVPPEYPNMDAYLAYMTWERAKKRYRELTPEIRERIEMELKIIGRMGYAGYFLIVQSFTTEARNRGVYVGPGRGSAAGSVVAYVLGIIDVDPLAYDLLFERFLNPDRISPPDIDIDFDDEGRQEVIDFVVQEYGRQSVSQVITYGTMGAKTALRDVGRTLNIPLAEVNRIAKMVPDKPGMTFKKAIDPEQNPDFADELSKLFKSTDPLINKMMRFARTLEGTARHTGVHACAVIIAPGDITDYAPVSKAKDDALVTQYDGPHAEMCGLLKMDFLGLKTLSIIKTAVKLAKQNRGIEVNPDEIDIEDKATYELYQRGDTVATFQFESDGMRKYLRQLKPTTIEDLIAMNALYRPGPMDNIPSFVNRKHGREPIVYPHAMLEPILKNTYGIMVYQEQIMQVARTMGGYSLGQADLLRRAMGKKKMDVMLKEKATFVAGAASNSVDKKVAEDVFSLMEKFASYGFNKCLPGDTEIVDAQTGRLVRIEDLYTGKARISHTITLDTDTYKLGQGEIAEVMENGVKPVYRITTGSGKEIEATGNHPFYTYQGWKRLDELKEGELIATPRILPVEGKKRWPEYALIALGHLLAEGNLCHPTSVYYYTQDDDQLTDYVKAAEKFENVKCSLAVHKDTYSVYAKRKERKKPNGIVDWAKELGIWGKNALQKEIPASVFELENENICLMISRLWEGDGHINVNGRSLFYATSSRRMARQLQHLFLRLGIVSRLRTVNFPYKEGRIGYQLFITGNDDIKAFAETVGVHFVSKKRKAGLKELYLEEVHFAVGTKDVIPVEIREIVRTAKDQAGLTWKEVNIHAGVSPHDFYPAGSHSGKIGFSRSMVSKLAAFFRSESLKKYAESDIYWDRITAIEYIGEKQTYDLEVPGTHNFVANDFIVHNSHAAAYSVLAFKTAYMKAHYPAEYMASVLTHNVSDIKKITFFIEECRRMGIEVLQPDVNESQSLFSVNPQGQIRFGLEAIKGVGHGVVEKLIEERDKNGPFTSLFDLTTRMPLRSINKKVIESLVYAGALDCFGVKRYQYFLAPTGSNGNGREDANVIEKAINYGSKIQQDRNSPQMDLFGGANGSSSAVEEPGIPLGTLQEGRILEAWTRLEELNFEKEVIGFYLSGHPLDRYKWQIEAFTNCTTSSLEEKKGNTVRLAGIVNGVRERISKNGNKFMSFTIEDFADSLEIVLFGDQYANFRSYIRQDEMLFITGAYQPRKYDPSEYELRILDIKLLTDELFEGMVRHLCVEIDNSELDEGLLDQLQALFHTHKGKKDLKFRIRDAGMKADIPLISSELQVSPNRELVAGLKELGLGLSFV